MGKDQTGGTGSEEEDVDADWGVELVETVDGACCGLEEGGFFIGEVVRLACAVGAVVRAGLST